MWGSGQGASSTCCWNGERLDYHRPQILLGRTHRLGRQGAFLQWPARYVSAGVGKPRQILRRRLDSLCCQRGSGGDSSEGCKATRGPARHSVAICHAFLTLVFRCASDLQERLCAASRNSTSCAYGLPHPGRPAVETLGRRAPPALLRAAAGHQRAPISCG